MPTALFISPHLDDVAFSCGGTAIRLAGEGWRTVVVTVFTASVPTPTGFALACQLDKGISAGVDYMALRRGEDERFADLAGIARLVWLGLPEAPHRGYASPAELFGTYRGDDDVLAATSAALSRLLEEEQPDMVFAPQSLGGHVDHRRTTSAVLALVSARGVHWYADLPYAIRQTGARSPFDVVDGLPESGLVITSTIAAKAAAVQAYTTQIGFQFGGPAACSDAVRSHAAAEADRTGAGAAAVEVVRCWEG